mmetsp:Transcript_106096/g.266977  ORF Transcript_106096/g.266977 Transcript_106096/m.266977 type:complete len:207 (+) Transcript_106096:140-760(+)
MLEVRRRGGERVLFFEQHLHPRASGPRGADQQHRGQIASRWVEQCDFRRKQLVRWVQHVGRWRRSSRRRGGGSSSAARGGRGHWLHGLCHHRSERLCDLRVAGARIPIPILPEGHLQQMLALRPRGEAAVLYPLPEVPGSRGAFRMRVQQANCRGQRAGAGAGADAGAAGTAGGSRTHSIARPEAGGRHLKYLQSQCQESAQRSKA